MIFLDSKLPMVLVGSSHLHKPMRNACSNDSSAMPKSFRRFSIAMSPSSVPILSSPPSTPFRALRITSSQSTSPLPSAKQSVLGRPRLSARSAKQRHALLTSVLALRVRNAPHSNIGKLDCGDSRTLLADSALELKRVIPAIRFPWPRMFPSGQVPMISTPETPDDGPRRSITPSGKKSWLYDSPRSFFNRSFAFSFFGSSFSDFS